MRNSNGLKSWLDMNQKATRTDWLYNAIRQLNEQTRFVQALSRAWDKVKESEPKTTVARELSRSDLITYLDSKPIHSLPSNLTVANLRRDH